MTDLTVNEAEYPDLLLGFDLLSSMAEWNQSVDRLASTALQQLKGTTTTSGAGWEDVIPLNRLSKLLLLKEEEPIARVAAVTRSRTRQGDPPEVLLSDVVQRMRAEYILQAQDEEKWIADLKAYMSGELDKLDADEARLCGKIADEYEVDESGLLLYCPCVKKTDGERDLVAKLVVPEQQDVALPLVWPTKSVPQYAGQCTDCESGKGRPGW
ncbi:hypothetical protein PC120_g24502 [Phytophthora cactorum]|nr:hypothetical protein PC120_g24502 [Phytophthora cactorum]